MQSEFKPTERQLQAINSNAQLTVIAAGPGAGKSATLVARIKRLIADGSAPTSIVAISFTNQAANVLTERLGQPIGFSGTLHSWILRLLMRYGAMVKLPKDLTVLDENEAKEFRDDVIASMNLKVGKKELEAAIAKGPPLITGPQPPYQHTPLSLVVTGYYQKLQQTGTLDYDSLLFFGERLMEHLMRVAIPLGDHLFVDEAQDSGNIDFTIYRKAGFRHKTFVADVDQSIFQFRGGNPKHFLALTSMPGATVIALEDNFRSDKAICTAAQQLIEHTIERFKKKTIAVSAEWGSIIVHQPFQLAAAEFTWIAHDIALKHKENFNEVAVLARTNHLVEEIALALQAQGVPVSKHTPPVTPTDWQTARLLVSLLCNPNNDYLAHKWIAVREGDAKAKSKSTEALTALTSLNECHLMFRAVNLPELPTVMRKLEISEDSIALVEQTVTTLTPGSTLHGLSLALAHNWSLAVEHQEGVSVSTIHSAKGMEFDAVYLAAFEEEIIPGQRKNVNIADERNLAYVAATRARHSVTVTWCSKRIPQFGPRVPENHKLSRYAMEMLDASSGHRQ